MRKIDIVWLIFMFFIICFCAFVMVFMFKNYSAFKENPFIYGAERMGGEVRCDCRQVKNNNIYNFWFNNTHWEAVPTTQYPIKKG